MKTLLVTGATSGIGFSTASALITEGHKVYITGRDNARLQNAATTLGATPILCDNTDYEAAFAMAEQFQKDGIQLDGVVLNAGIFYPRPLELETVDNLAITMNTNFTGPFLQLQALVPVLKNPASVVYISSIAAAKAHPACAVYAASKAAFEAAANVSNIELAPKGIRVNWVRPGVTLTEVQAKAGMTPEQIAELAESLKAIPAGRILAPADIVPAVQYLLSDASSAMLAGCITVDGGFSL